MLNSSSSSRFATLPLYVLPDREPLCAYMAGALLLAGRHSFSDEHSTGPSCRSMSRQPSGPRRMTKGTIATARMCGQREHLIQHQ
jgi:hypothetical protein